LVSKKEISSLDELTEKYNKLIEPTLLAKAGKKIGEHIPDKVKEVGGMVKENITEKELYIAVMKEVAEGFKKLQEITAQATISKDAIIEQTNEISKRNEIESLDEFCLLRSYELAKLVNKFKTRNTLLACAEGAGTGVFGFAGLPFNLVLSTLLYFRAVQTVAMYYGYDIKEDAAELEIASDVFMNALSPASTNTNELTSMIGKFMVITETTAIKQTAKKSWEEMATRGGAALLLTQMRALANKTVKKSLEKAGQKGLEESVFKGIFEQIGKKLTKKAVERSMPVIGGAIGALFDTAIMSKVIKYADIFYQKRFIIEKEARINYLLHGEESEEIYLEDNEN
jgi:hypothetical protein